MAHWYYLSFAGEQGFLGGAYVQAETTEGAYFRSITLGINPGGEVKIVGPLPDEAMSDNVPADQRERLLAREEVEA